MIFKVESVLLFNADPVCNRKTFVYHLYNVGLTSNYVINSSGISRCVMSCDSHVRKPSARYMAQTELLSGSVCIMADPEISHGNAGSASAINSGAGPVADGLICTGPPITCTKCDQ